MVLKTGLLITGDASAAQKAVENVKQGLSQLGMTSTQARQNIKDLDAAQKAAGGSSEILARIQARSASAIKDVAGAAGEAGSAMGAISAGASSAAGAVDDATKKLRQHAQAQNDNEAAARRNAFGMRNLGQQAGDMAVMIQGGIDPMRAFATQAGQMGYALSEMGGKAGAVGAFLTGPWGIALTIAVTSLAPFVSKLWETEQAAKQAELATGNLADIQNSLADLFGKASSKIAEQNTLLRINARIKANDAAEKAKEDAKDAATVFKRAGASGGLGGALRAVNTIFGTGEGRGLDMLGIGTGNAAVYRLAERARRANSIKDIEAKEQAFDRITVDSYRTNFSGSAIDGTKFREAISKSLAAAVTKRAAELANSSLDIGKVDPLLKKTGGSGAVGGGTAVLDQEAKLAAATSARERAQAQLALTQTRGRAAVDAGTMSEAQYRDAVTAGERAVNAAEAAERGAAASRRDGNKQRQEAAKAAREAEQAERQLEASLDRLASRYDPVKAAARGYREELEEVSKLVAAGKLTQGEAFDYQMRGRAGAVADQAREFGQAFRSIIGDDAIAAANNQLTQGVESASVAYRNGLQAAARSGGEALTSAVTGVADLFGVRIGSSLGAFSKAGHQHSNDAGAAIGSMATKIGTFFSKEGAEALGRNVGDFAGKRLQGASEGQAAAGLAGMFGVKTNSGGAAIGGALGSLATFVPGGSIIGGLAGGILGGLFGKSAPRGSAVITSATDDAKVGGDKRVTEALSGSAKNVQSALSQIASAFGAELGAFNVSIGKGTNNYRVSASGSTQVGAKNPKGASFIYDGPDADVATSYAIRDAISDGAIAGVSAKVKQGLMSSTDINKAMAEGLKVQAVEMSLEGVAGSYKKAFTDLAAQAKDRVRIAQQYGFDVLAIEKKNAEDRKKLNEQLVQAQAGSLQALVKEMTSGSLFEGTAMERIDALNKDIAKAKLDLDAGKEGAADTLASLYQQRLAASKDAYATTGNYAADRNATIAEAQAAIARVNQQVAAAERQSDPALSVTNAALDENNNQNATLVAQNTRILEVLEANNKLLQAATSRGVGWENFGKEAIMRLASTA